MLTQGYVFKIDLRERERDDGGEGRERERERERREREIDVREKHQSVASLMCPDLTGDRTHNMGMFPYWESTPESFWCIGQHCKQLIHLARERRNFLKMVETPSKILQQTYRMVKH